MARRRRKSKEIALDTGSGPAEARLERHERLFDELRGGLVILDEDRRIVRTNPSAQRLLAPAGAPVVGRPVSEFARPEDRPAIESAVDSPGDIDEIEWRTTGDDGAVKYVRQTTTPIEDGRLLLQLTDMSQVRQVELALRRQAELYESLMFGLDALGDGVAVADDESVLFVNTALADMLGYEQSQLVGEPWPAELVPREMRSWWRRMWRGQEPEAPRDRYGLTLCTRDGRRIDVEVATRQVRPDSPLRLLVVRDVTERNVRFAEQLQLAAIVEASSDAIGSLDVDGRVTRWNRGAEQVFGIARAQAVGMSFVEFVADASRPPVEAAMRSVLEGETRSRHAVEGHRADGTTIDLSIACSPLRDDAQNVIGIAVVARDVSEQRRLERELTRFAADLQVANRDLEHASHVRSEFVSMASHELRTPLTTISGFARTMLDLGPQVAERDKLDYLELIDSQAQRLTRLVDNLLTVSRFESGRITTHPRRFAVAERLTAVIASLGLEQVTLECDPQLTVTCDPDHIEQIVENLIANARKYGEPEFRIDATRTADDMFLIVVSDHGRGVPPDFVPHLFERFTRSTESIVEDIDGAGLGLAIVHWLAEAGGGRAWYEPNEPTGSRFCVTLCDLGPDWTEQRA